MKPALRAGELKPKAALPFGTDESSELLAPAPENPKCISNEHMATALRCQSFGRQQNRDANPIVTRYPSGLSVEFIPKRL
ncbi:MAG: hypothetical protein ACLQU1_08995 [Bryobacteraceae bacterium]